VAKKPTRNVSAMRGFGSCTAIPPVAMQYHGLEIGTLRHVRSG
jgi:hypothetical protein